MDSAGAAFSSGPGKIVFQIAIFVILAVGLYYLWKFLQGSSGSLIDNIVYSSPNSGLPGMSTTASVYDQKVVPPIYQGGQYSVSTWIYITNWGVNGGYNKPFLTLNGGGNSFTTMVMYLGQNVNKLGIRVSTDAVKIDTAAMTNIRPTTGNGYGVSPYTDTAGDFKMCDIESVDIQRWVNINAVLDGRTLDVYIDGKLSRSCVLSGMFNVDGSAPTLSLGGPYGFGGLIGKTQTANFAYSPDQVYKIYQNGPLDNSLLSQVKGYFNPGQYSFNISRNGQSLASGATA
jgi:hypothetical protein